MAKDDTRMHGGNTPGMTPDRGHERHEDPVAKGDAIGTDPGTPREGDQRDADAAGSTTDREQDSALGGHTATKSSGE
ncbi:hypothetical protein ACBY01_00065 [Sphingomonas sp. ac-8]|uniref:hypothetical protein n=1 Tax=Sphingomonas sp. ac-8 TaxID=3242977 RepID=UPI003A7FC61E